MVTASLFKSYFEQADEKIKHSLLTQYRTEANDTLLVYEPLRDTFMVRRGFTAAALAACAGELYVVTEDGRVERFDDSLDYDGDPIEAYWVTPYFDLGDKQVKKTLGELIATGSGDDVRVTVQTDRDVFQTVLSFPESGAISEAVLRGEGRIFRLRFGNIAGGVFSLDAGVTLRLDAQRRPE